jgi:RimJ/RimL family protein N-acetyltransferase
MRYQPSLQTERLRLRPFVADDADTLVQLADTPEIAATTLSIPHPYSMIAAKNWIVGLPHLYRTGSAIHYAICLLESKQMIGAIALREIDRKNGNAELEFWLGQAWRKQGYASEALQQALDFAFRRLKLHRIYAFHFTEDLVSAKFLKKHGFALEGVLREAVRKTTNYQDLSLSGLLAESLLVE